MPELQLYSGRAIDVPACFISGASDWGIHQKPGELEAMEAGRSCRDYRGTTLIDGAGHWVQQEKPVEAAERLLAFFEEARR